jgi:hypothetical protein
MALKLITPPASEPVDLWTAKTHLRVDYSDQDAEITALIKTARTICEMYQHKAYINQTWQLTLDRFPDGRPPSSLYGLYSHPPVAYQDFKDHIIIPISPLQTVNSINYYLVDNTQVTMTAGTQYFVDTQTEPGQICLPYMVPWPLVILRPNNGVIINFTAGYGLGGSNVPPEVISAMLLLISHLYEHREATADKVLSELPFGVQSLLDMDRRF